MGETIVVDLHGEQVQVLPEEVEIRMEAHEGLSAASEGLYLAALVTEITPDLELEGLAREFVRRVQELRKVADLSVDERIEVLFRASDRLVEAVDAHREYIVGETLAARLKKVDQPEGQASEKHTFDGEELEIALNRFTA
jgi:isoleucyl-tRNA synthetase